MFNEWDEIDKRLTKELFEEVETLIKKLDKQKELSQSLGLTDIKPLGDCPLIDKLPIGAIRKCMEKHEKCHCKKISYTKKCEGGYLWQ